MKRTKLLLGGVAAAAVAAIGLSGGLANAATSSPPPSSKVLLAVIPTRAEIPVSQHNETIKLYSGSTAPLRVTASTEALSQTSKGLVLQQAPPQYGGAWLNITPSTFTLQPGQQRAIHVSIAIPPHQVGQRNLAVVFRAAAPKGTHKGSGAVISAGVASSLIVDVPGKTVVHPSYELAAPGFSTGGPVNMTATLNNGPSNFYLLANNLHVTSGSSTVAQLAGQIVLAGAHTTEPATWTTPPMFGFPAHLTLMSDGQPVATASVYIFPLFQALGLVALVAALVVITLLMRRRRRHVIAREVSKRLAQK